jgi:hypothetical protein
MIVKSRDIANLQLDIWCDYGAITHHIDFLEYLSCRDKASPLLSPIPNGSN